MDDISVNRQIRKFGLYGFFKNLKFFEPFLWLYLIINDISLFQIGLLYSIRESLIYVFEIPSGVLADRYGKKNELFICFLFYIVSFLFFFLATDFIHFAIAMVFYGLGEAFRSGTHKAMIMQYLDHEEVRVSKSQVYGFTRSYSNIGSALSSLLGIIFILLTPEIRYLFLIAIVPYLIDIILVSSYPSYLNQRIDTVFSFRSFLTENIKSVFYALKEKKLRLTLLNSASYHAVFKTMKDYVQPIIISLSIVIWVGLSADDNTNVILGLIYFIAYLVSVFSSKYTYKLEKIMAKETVTNIAWFLTSILLIVLGLLVDIVFIVIVMFILFYALLNIRKPFMVEIIGDRVINEKRASVLSIESQLTSLFIMVLAPIIGYIADYFGVNYGLIGLGSLMVVGFFFHQNKKSA
jgi:MFS family permease